HYMKGYNSHHISPFIHQGHDEEAVVDLGKTSSTLHTNFEKEELESHRAVYVGVHVPLGRQGRRRHRHRGHRHHRKRRERGSDREDGRESPTYDTPSQRVQFILGTEDDDEEHIPHDLFTELDELSFRDGHAYEWKETARWLKFEEDVEDGGERWSKPYVATLSLHSLFELRSCILNGTVMLDMRANTIEEIADMALDSMVASGQLDESLRENVRDALLKRHHHQNEKKLSNRIPLVRSFADIGEGLSASRLSLLKRALSTSTPDARRKSRESRGSRVSVNLLPSPTCSPCPSPMTTPQNTPPSSRRTPVLPWFLSNPQQSPQLLVVPGELEGIPQVVVSPPEEDEEEFNCKFWGTNFPFLCHVEGLLASPQSAPGILENSKPSESRVNGAAGSRENSTVDFSKVDMNFMKKIPPGAEASNVLVGEVDFLERPIIAFIRLSPAVLLTGLTEVPVPTRFLFLLLGPCGKGTQYHEIGRSIATLMTDEEKRKMPAVPNGSAPTSDTIKEEGHHTGPELQRTGRFCGGLVRDVKCKAPFYWSDIRDALSLQCLASILFLYCACMSPVITFGGLLGEATKDNISAIESLFGASMTGVAYSLFAGQPLTILGSTGPVLVFEKILFRFCSDYGLSYLPLRTSIGLWTAFLCLVLVATDASSLVCYITRFTEEAFASLICIIFIYEALEKLVKLGEDYPINMKNNLDNLTFYTCRCSPPLNTSNQTLEPWNQTGFSPDSLDWSDLDKPVSMKTCFCLHGEFVGPACGHSGPYIPDVLFWSVILFFTTFFLSSFLKQFKTKRYFPTKVRSTISDFAIFLTIMIMVLLDYLVGVPSPKLKVPDRFKPTSDKRGWFISPLDNNPPWTLLAAAIPALLCTILIFMDQQITAVIINRKEHKLKKSCGYHLDLFVVAVMLGVCSVMGLPWFVAATVLSISHVNSLKLESECSAPGEQPKFLGIREQRVTGVMIFVLMGLSVFMTSVLKFIPMPVLYGVFLYMGVSSLKGIQFFDRIKLFGMPAKHQPDLIYLRYVPLWKVHIFTIIQLTCLVLLWVIKVSTAAVVFPMMVLALVFVRKLLDVCFTKRELSWLDDLMPESKKKKEDDKKKKEKEEAQRMLEVDNDMEIPYDAENLPKMPEKTLKVSSDPSVVNISDEMAKTAVWKAVAMNSDTAKVQKTYPSEEKASSVKISIEDDRGQKFIDTETSL
uniref:Anion exchange protein n=1 Tax=Denticeps clupeoides TaxID=299321 RepID=A0AAY3ZZD4_9TELE